MSNHTYQDSLNLPQTDFPMKANLSAREPKHLEKWEHFQLYEKLRKVAQGRPKYILHDGPPYANGHLHIGHAVNKILKDIIVKAKTLAGFDAPFVPGWDCHGLPIELNVEKLFKAQNKVYTPQAFRKACRQYATEQITIQRREFKRLGILADWERPYLTMDFQFEAQIIRTLARALETGYLQPGFKPVHWCTACTSALAELEVEYQDKTSMAIDVRFRLKGNYQLPGQGPVSIPIWTTTPWTLPANEAVALGSDIVYSLIQTPQERLIIAAPLVAACLARYEVSHFEILGSYTAKQLQHAQLQHPFEPRAVPLIISDHVAIDTGTGAVHIAPSHGPDDYKLGQHYQLPLLQRVDSKGCYQLDIPLLHSKPVLKSYPLIHELLTEHQTLLCAQALKHSYPHCWRHKTPLIFLATSQWFLSLQQPSFQNILKQSIKQVQWMPEWGTQRMLHMVDGRPDWCLSRQRQWGVPLPFFIHRHTKKLHPRTAEYLSIIAEQVEHEGVEAWYTLDPKSLLGETAQDYYKLTDTLDVWFDSGVTHDAVLKQHPQLKWPADLYLEGSDQFRGWFQSSLLTAVALDKKPPYRTVLTHGFTVDQQGRKMSKSLGNVIGLDSIIQKWGADILRLWITATDTRKEMAVSNEILQRISEAYRRIRNTLRFLLGNLYDFSPEKDQLKPQELLSIDRWILARVTTLQTHIQSAYEAFNFHNIYQTIYQFCINELGSFYLSILKDRLYTMQASSIGRRSAQTALYQITEALLRWLAPILSFTAEEAWSYLPGPREQSIFLSTWHSLSTDLTGDPLAPFYQEAGGCEACWNQLITIRDQVNKAIETAREAGQLGTSLEASVKIYCHPNSLLARLLNTIKSELHFILLSAETHLITEEPLHLEADENCFRVTVMPMEVTTKCSRCWHRHSEIGKHATHPSLCARCIENLPTGLGEQRLYA